jgi:hypothetical protein
MLVDTGNGNEEWGMIFPNPTTGEFILRMNSEFSNSCKVQILDRLGRIIQSVPLSPGTVEQVLSLTAQPTGIYFIKILDGSESVWLEKIVKQ